MALMDELLLIFAGWLAYGLLHSLLASSRVKAMLKPALEKTGLSYRLYFTFFAVLSPIPLLWFQWKSESVYIWPNPYILRLAGGMLAGLGLAVLRKAFSVYDSHLFFGLSKDEEHSEEFKKDGLLRVVRHPLYLATLMIFWGWFLFNNSWQNLAFCTANTLYIFIGIAWEEKKLIGQYGQKYLDYKASTPMIFPRWRAGGKR